MEDFIDWQFCCYLSGAPFEYVVADLDKLCPRQASTIRVRLFLVETPR